MNLIDDLGNDLAIAFLVEKKYAEKMNTRESLALLTKIRATLHHVSRAENADAETNPPARSVVNRGN